MTIAALQSGSLELVDEYLRAAAISALHVWSAQNGAMVQMEAVPDPRRPTPPRGIEHVLTVWLRGSLSVQLKAKCRDALTGDFTWRGNWVAFPAVKIGTVIDEVARQIGVETVPDRTARDRAAVVILGVEQLFQRRRETGDLRGLAKDYRDARLGNPALRQFPTWGAYVRELRRRAVAEAARANGAAVIMGRSKA